MKTVRLSELLAIALICFGGFLLVGCTTLSIDDKNTGIALKTSSFLTKQGIKSVSVRDANGVSRTISGFSSDQVEAMGVMADAMLKAAVKP